jgi:hypothetical protein
LHANDVQSNQPTLENPYKSSPSTMPANINYGPESPGYQHMTPEYKLLVPSESPVTSATRPSTPSPEPMVCATISPMPMPAKVTVVATGTVKFSSSNLPANTEISITVNEGPKADSNVRVNSTSTVTRTYPVPPTNSRNNVEQGDQPRTTTIPKY